jgi:multidrug resistance efflux pump
MSIQNNVVELPQNEPEKSAQAYLQGRASPRSPQACLARRRSGARLAWAAIGTLTGAVLALAGVVLALVYLILKRPIEGAAAVAPAAATGDHGAKPSTSSAGAANDFKGYILPLQPILVSPKVTGTIVKLNVGEGCRVKKGDVLAELDDVDYKADCRRAEWSVEKAEQQLAEAQTSQPKEIGQAEAEIERSKLELGQLQADFERARDLYYKQAASKTEYESSETKFHEAEQHIRSLDYALEATRGSLSQKIATARSQLQEAQADLTRIRWRLNCCTVRAPCGGTILKKNVEEGGLASTSASLCELANLSDLEVEVAIPECDIRTIRPGERCRVRTEAFPDRIYDGVVSRVMPVANRAESAIPIRVKIAVPQEEEGVYLKPEMIARVSFLSGAVTASLDDAGSALCQLPLRRHRPIK